MTETETTTITLKKPTRDRLAKLGTLDESFDDVVNELLNESRFVSEIEPLLVNAKTAFDGYTADSLSSKVETFRNLMASMPKLFAAIDRFVGAVKKR